jgi:hypothetical protein
MLMGYSKMYYLKTFFMEALIFRNNEAKRLIYRTHTLYLEGQGSDLNIHNGYKPFRKTVGNKDIHRLQLLVRVVECFYCSGNGM